jgi:hypothetical protein
MAFTVGPTITRTDAINASIVVESPQRRPQIGGPLALFSTRERRRSGVKRPPDTEAQKFEPNDSRVPDAAGRAEKVRKVVPGTAASHTENCVATLTPH